MLVGSCPPGRKRFPTDSLVVTMHGQRREPFIVDWAVCGRGTRELIRKPRPLVVIRNRRLNGVALLDPLRSVQFSSVSTKTVQRQYKETNLSRGGTAVEMVAVS